MDDNASESTDTPDSAEASDGTAADGIGQGAAPSDSGLTDNSVNENADTGEQSTNRKTKTIHTKKESVCQMHTLSFFLIYSILSASQSAKIQRQQLHTETADTRRNTVFRHIPVLPLCKPAVFFLPITAVLLLITVQNQLVLLSSGNSHTVVRPLHRCEVADK